MTRHVVVMVTSSYPRFPGDSHGPFVERLSEELAALGHTVDVLVPDDAELRLDGRAPLTVSSFRYLVPRSAQDAMNATSAGVAPDVDELHLAGLSVLPSLKVAPPRIAASPVAYECRLHTPLEVSPNQLIAIGEIVHAHVDDAFVLDASRHHIATDKLDLIGRMQGRDWYVGTEDAFQIARP